jgi:hypothetical protein
MSNVDREELLKTDWLSVQMVTIHGPAISLVTHDGPKLFVFGSEAEARAVFEVWLASGSDDQRLARLKKVHRS